MNFSTPHTINPPLPTPHTLLLDLLNLLDTGASLPTITKTLTCIKTACTLLSDPTEIIHVHLDPHIALIVKTARHINENANASNTPNERTRYITAMHTAASAMSAEIRDQREKYEENMSILLAQTMKKMRREAEERGGSFDYTVRRLGKDGMDAARALGVLVGERPTAAFHAGFLSEIARYWRRWAGTAEARLYEEVWTYVSGRVLVQE